jgi:hypothetical protein
MVAIASAGNASACLFDLYTKQAGKPVANLVY